MHSRPNDPLTQKGCLRVVNQYVYHGVTLNDMVGENCSYTDVPLVARYRSG